MKLLHSRSILFVCTVTLILSGCSLGGIRPKPDVSLVDIRFDNVTLFETEGLFTVRIENEGDRPLPLDGAVHRIYLNDEYIGKGLADEEITVPPFGSVTQAVKVRLQNFSMIGRINSILRSERISYRIESRMSVDGSIFPWSVESESEGTLDFRAFDAGPGV